MDAFFKAVFPAGPPSLGMDRRPGTLDADAVRKAVAAHARPVAGAPAPDRLRLLEGVSLLWNDCFEQCHEIAQAREGERDFDTLHAIFHRREGDFPNSSYWFRSAGKHPSYPILERRIASLLDEATAAILAPDGRWSSSAFVDEVRKRGRGTGDAVRLLERVQAEELLAYAEWLLAY